MFLFWMKSLFISAKAKNKIDKFLIEIASKKLPKNIAIAYSLQYKDLASEVKGRLSKNHNITGLMQVLGCSKPKFPKDTQAILLIGSGKFHAVSLGLETKLPIYILQHILEKISDNEIKQLEKNNKASYLKFLNSDKIGILISTKPGQQRFQKALSLKNKLKSKKSYLFVADNINIQEFENFKLESWVNTACPRLDMNSNSIININNLNSRQRKNSF